MQTLAVQQGDLDKSGTCERMIWQRAICILLPVAKMCVLCSTS